VRKVQVCAVALLYQPTRVETKQKTHATYLLGRLFQRFMVVMALGEAFVQALREAWYNSSTSNRGAVAASHNGAHLRALPSLLRIGQGQLLKRRIRVALLHLHDRDEGWTAQHTTSTSTHPNSVNHHHDRGTTSASGTYPVQQRCFAWPSPLAPVSHAWAPLRWHAATHPQP